MCLNKSIDLLRTPFLCLGLLINNFMVYSAPNLHWEVHQEVTLLEFRCFIIMLLIYSIPPSDHYNACFERFEAEMMGIMCSCVLKINTLFIHILTTFKKNVDPIQKNDLRNKEVTFKRYKSWECL